MSRRKSLALVSAGALAGLLAGGGFSTVGFGLLGSAATLDADDAAPAEAAASPAEGGLLQLTAGQSAAAGVRVARLTSTETGVTVAGYAHALDLSPLATIASEIATADAALRASSSEQARLANLVRADAGASQRELEAASAQASADRARLTLACQRVGLEYGPGLSRLGCGAIAGLAREGASGRLALLRIDVPGATLNTGAKATIDLAPGQVQVTLIGPASTGDSTLQTSGMLAVLRGAPAARVGVGRVLQATLEGGPRRSGLLVPREALVRVDGGLYAWRVSGPNRFERVALAGAAAHPAGWIVPTGTWQPGQSVVVVGAGTLLGLEHAAPAAGDD